jgi:hypothetical protein
VVAPEDAGAVLSGLTAAGEEAVVVGEVASAHI